ncbi:MAG: hypothetical protein LUQ09_02540 [Methanomassiliicoccales archaeon]|nr:hypothetical protein [Methanomassiliicoccales archaeon]
MRNRPNHDASTISYFSSAEISGIMSVLVEREKEALDELTDNPGGHKRMMPRPIKAKRQHLMFRLGFELGPLVSEIIGILWEDLDKERKTIRL